VNDDTQTPDPPPAPPIAPGPVVAAPTRPAWPVVLGVMVIVFASLTILGGLTDAAGAMFMGAFMPLMNEDAPAVVEAMRQFAGWKAATGLAGAAVGGLGVVAGIGLLRRRPWAPSACIAWAALRILTSAAGAALDHLQQQAMFQAMAEDDPQMAAAAGFGGMMLAFHVAWMLVWGWAFPIFVLIWLSLPGPRREIATWN
jgi:hypothetical protein